MPSRDERKIDAQFFRCGQRVEIGSGCKIPASPVLHAPRPGLLEPPDTVEFFLWILSGS